MNWFETIILSIVQGLTEFLPVSSSAHIFIVSKLFFGNDPGASFTAVIQLGTEMAVLCYFWNDIYSIALAWIKGILNKQDRLTKNYRLGWQIIIGSIPIGIFGFLFKDQVRGAARNLYLVATALILFSAVIYFAEKFGKKILRITDLNTKNSLLIGLSQVLALIPGVSRSGATTSAGLFLNYRRRDAVKISFYLAIPAVIVSGIFSLGDIFGRDDSISGLKLIIAVIISFLVGYVIIKWFIDYVGNNSLLIFVVYRIILGVVILACLAKGII